MGYSVQDDISDSGITNAVKQIERLKWNTTSNQGFVLSFISKI